MNQEQRSRILDILISRLGPSELKQLAFTMLGPGAYDNLSGGTFRERAIAFMERLGQLNIEEQLPAELARMRPDIDLSGFESEGLTQENRRAAVSALVDHFQQSEQSQEGGTTVNTGGGAYFGGNISAGGDVVGGDKHVNDNSKRAGRDIAEGNIINNNNNNNQGGSDSNIIAFSVMLFAIFAIIALVVLVIVSSRGAMPLL